GGARLESRPLPYPHFVPPQSPDQRQDDTGSQRQVVRTGTPAGNDADPPAPEDRTRDLSRRVLPDEGQIHSCHLPSPSRRLWWSGSPLHRGTGHSVGGWPENSELGGDGRLW